MAQQECTSNRDTIDVRGHCPSCGGERWSQVHGDARQSYDDDESPVSWGSIYRILQCRGCKTFYFQKVDWFSEVDEPDVTHYPAPSKRERPEWFPELQQVDRDFYELFDSVYTALDNDLRVLAAIGIHTAFDRGTELLEIDPSLSFARKLDALIVAGKIGLDEKKDLGTLTDAGSAAAHRGWRPTLPQLATLMATIEHFVYRNFILTKQAAALQGAVPQKRKVGPK